MKVKNLTLVNGDIYDSAEMHSPKRVLPEEMDAMVVLSFGKTSVYINSAMIVSFELESELKSDTPFRIWSI
ncbi:hypothetical protein D3C74_229200 [compost metagenome]